MIYDIFESILAETGEFTPGGNMFSTYMPAVIDIGVMVRAPIEGLRIDQDIRGRFTGRYQVVTRHIDPEEGMAMALRVKNALTIDSRRVFDATKNGRVVIDQFLPETLPISYPRLDGNGFEFSQHFKTVFSAAL